MNVVRLPGAATELVEDLKSGMIFLYPTDTVYGIGCNALAGKSVMAVRRLKQTRHPFSVIAPSRKWMRRHLTIQHDEFMDRLPGPYTLIFKKKQEGFLKECSPTACLGVRIPRHPFAACVQRAGVPFVTTSANRSGEAPVTQISEIPAHFRERIDVAIDGGTLKGCPSCVVDLSGRCVKIVRTSPDALF